MEKYEAVLALLKEKNGRLEMTDPDLLKLLSRDETGKPNLVSRMSGYVSYIRRLGEQLEVKGIRNGRTVVAYELVRAGYGKDGPIWQNSKYWKNPASTDTDALNTDPTV